MRPIPAVVSAYQTLADAFEEYDEALYDAYDEVTPFVLYDEAEDAAEDAEDDDLEDLDDLDDDEIDDLDDLDDSDEDDDSEDDDEDDARRRRGRRRARRARPRGQHPQPLTSRRPLRPPRGAPRDRVRHRSRPAAAP